VHDKCPGCGAPCVDPPWFYECGSYYPYWGPGDPLRRPDGSVFELVESVRCLKRQNERLRESLAATKSQQP